MRTTYIEAQKAKVHRRMKIEDGATPAGDDPPVDYLRALEAAGQPEQVEEVRAAHAEGRGPPEWTKRGDQS